MGQYSAGPTQIAGDFDLPSIPIIGSPTSGLFSVAGGFGFSLQSIIYFLQTQNLLAIGQKTPPTGVLTPLAGFPLASSTNPVGMAIHPSGKFLYVTSSGATSITAYSVNPVNGSLTVLAGFPFSTAPNTSFAMTITPNGKFLYITSANANIVMAYSINQLTGALTAIATYATGANPRRLVTNGALLYVGNSTGNSISAYTINATTGALTAVAGSPFAAGNGVQGLGLHPNGLFLYCANQTDNTISAFSVTPATGVLAQITNSPFVTGAAPGDLVIDPLGHFLYAANSGAGAVQPFTIDSVSGRISAVAGGVVVTGNQPYAMAIDPLGELLLVCDSTNNNVATFMINDVTGALTVVAGSPFAAGNSPRIPLIDPTGKFAYVANGVGNTISGYSTSATINLPLLEGTIDQTGSGLSRLNVNGEFDIGGVRVINPEQLVFKSSAPVTAPADITEDILATIQIPALNANDHIKIYSLWDFTNNANAKTLKVYLNSNPVIAGGVAYENMNAANFASAYLVTDLHNLNNVASQIGYAGSGYGLSALALTTSAINTANPCYMVFTSQKTVAGDSIRLVAWRIVRITDGT